MAESNIIGSVMKAINVLNMMAKEPYEYTALEISREVGLNRTTVHRLLSTLVEGRMVIQSKSTSKYMIGPQAYRMGMAYKYGFDSEDVIKKIINETGKQLRMSVGYSIKDGMDVISLYDVEQYADVLFGYKIGSKWPLYRGASGKSVIAFHEPLSELVELVQVMKMDKKTENTITDPVELLKDYENIRKRGYAISDEESIIGAMGIGYPVRNPSGEVIATVSIATIKASMDEARIKEVVGILRETAGQIENHIF